MLKYAIVVIGYNRTDNIKRLLESLKSADYSSDNVPLIISIDKSNNLDVEGVANDFIWPHGQKIIKTYPERQGLRKHILACGNFLKEYDAIAVFEDDTFASPAFYNYMKQAVEFYKDDMNIAGISLYSHLWNVNANYPFIPQSSKYDNYFLQFAQSWGQIWMKKQWFEFVDWYNENSISIEKDPDVPEYVTGWSDKSWLKYHIKYCIKKKKYFVYPYQGLSTCFNEAGEHCLLRDDVMQIPMEYNLTKQYQFLEFCKKNDGISYDGFFEREDLGKNIGIEDEYLTVDLYGTKTPKLAGEKKYLLSSNTYNYKIIKSFERVMRPIEMNVIYNMAGESIYLYNTEQQNFNKRTRNFANEFKYFHRIHGHTRIIVKLLKSMVIEKVKLILLRFKI
ncbi:hypothetical protein P4639_07525 [Priestia megaterium]|uniref:hypothetical protein n=1 Tax=Priestia megaterium TaxID=1404 RepID=UPI002E232AAD|nr:hypothetical protein [Priestia megaterium]